jgi:hypothetical protein
VRLQKLAMLMLLAGCEAEIVPGGVSLNHPPPANGGSSSNGAGSNGGGPNGGGGGSSSTGPDVSCDTTLYPDTKLTSIAADFAANVFPAMNRTTDGCVSCHAPGLGRNFLVTADGTDTFYKAQEAGYFDDKPSTVLARIISTDPVAHMPNNGKWWPNADIEAAARIACQVKAYEQQGGVPIDEQFPPDLVAAYTGAPNTDYDNSFINFLQLKGKVKAVFADSWVRGPDGGTDQFEANISQFGGADYVTQYTEQSTVTADFLLGMDKLAPDVCTAAAQNKTGPFAGFNLTQVITDVAASQTLTFLAGATDGSVTRTSESGATSGFGNASGTSDYFCYTNCLFASAVSLPSQGSYQFTVTAKAQDAAGGPTIEVKLDGNSLGMLTFTDQMNFVTQTVTANVSSGGMHSLSWSFVNDYYNADAGDRNVYLRQFQVIGPSGGGMAVNQTAARNQLNTMYQRMLYRDATTAELDSTYQLLSDLSMITTLPDSWEGVCEALIRHPDFLFTVSPSLDTMTGAPRQKLLLLKLGLDLLGRPPTAAELAQLTGGKTFDQMVDTFFTSPDFKTYYFSRMRQRTESTGTDIGDEPARLWTWLALNGQPFSDLFVADYMVDTSWNKATRSPEHGKSGILTMAGYLQGKQGLPHFNFAARTFTGFMGRVFEIPPEVFAMRANATAASTVDPTSICFNCHQVLTPMTMQRTAWDDQGNYLTVDSLGQPIDDTDRGLVAAYPFKGKGMEAFGTQAVKKEAFILAILQSQFRIMLGRNMRFDQDERVLFKTLWDLTKSTNGDLKQILKAITLDKAYQRAP